MARKKTNTAVETLAKANGMPPVSKMKDLNAELAKQNPTEPGLTGYLRARIKAGK